MKRRKPNASSQSSHTTSYDTLEARNLLAGMFAFNGERLEISVATIDNRVIIQQSESEYAFRLQEGTWTGIDENGARGNEQTILRLEKSALDDAFAGIHFDDPADVDPAVVFHGAGDYSDMAGTMRFTGLRYAGQTPGSPVKLYSAYFETEFANFMEAENEFVGIGFQGNQGRFNVAGDVSLGGGARFTQRLEVTSGGSISVANTEVNYRALVLNARDRIEISSDFQFSVTTLKLTARDIEVHAFSDYYEDEFLFPTSIGRLNFNAQENVRILTGDTANSLVRTRLFGDNTATSLTMDLQGSLSMEKSASLLIHSEASIQADHSIRLGSHADNRIEIGGDAAFHVDTYTGTYDFVEGNSNISIGSAAEVVFSELTLSGNPYIVNITVDTYLEIDNIDLPESFFVNLNARYGIGDKADSDIYVPGILRLTSNDMILLGESTNNLSIIGNFQVYGDSIYIGGKGDQRFDRINFRAANDVRIAEDDSMLIVGDNEANCLTVSSRGSITNGTNATITVDRALQATAKNRILLANRPTEEIHVAGIASFSSGISVIVGKGGYADFANLQFNTGQAIIHDHTHTHLVGTVRANEMRLTSSSYITDRDDLDLEIVGLARFNTPKGVLLGNAASNELRFCDRAHFNADEFAVIKSDSDVTLPKYSVSLANQHARISVDNTTCS